MRRVLLTALIALALPAPGLAATLHCLGRDPNFMLVIDGDTALLDYLGDGEFQLSPSHDRPIETFARFEIETAGGPVPVFLQRRDCPAFGAMLPLSVELGVPAFAGQAPIFGCCRELP